MTKNLFCIGASTRLAYQKFLPDFLSEECHTDGPQVNCGDSSNTLKNLEKWLEGKQPTHLTINCGMHDIRFSIKEKNHQTPITNFESNLKKIFLKLKSRNIPNIFWHTMIPFDENKYNHKKMLPGTTRIFHRFQEDFDLYDQKAIKIAKDIGINVINFANTGLKKEIACYISEDGIHYHNDAYKMIAEKIAQYINKKV